MRGRRGALRPCAVGQRGEHCVGVVIALAVCADGQRGATLYIPCSSDVGSHCGAAYGRGAVGGAVGGGVKGRRGALRPCADGRRGGGSACYAYASNKRELIVACYHLWLGQYRSLTDPLLVLACSQ